MASLTLQHVSKVYRGGVNAVEDVSLQVEDGEFVCLVGPSGCGKSTTLNIVAGLEGLSSGEVLIDGKQVTHLSPRERDVAMVFQSYALYPHLTVAENLAFPLKTAGLPREETKRRVEETASLLGIGALLGRKPKALSGGQRQRVALGRALVRRPTLFLFDEPLSNLDAALRTQTRAELKRLHQSLKGTFLYVTHDQVEAMTLADRVVVMNQGRVEQVGQPGALYRSPSTRFVATFFGTPRINIVSPRTLGLSLPEDVQLGIRAEHVEVRTTPPAPDAGFLEATLFLLEPMGAETWVTVERNGERLVARAPGDFAAPLGAQLWFRVDSQALLAFDAKTGASRSVPC